MGNVSSAGGIFSSYGKHSAEMPQRLMEALIVDGGTRLLKTAAACSCSTALYSSLPHPLFYPSAALSVSYLKISLKESAPFCSVPPSWETGESPGALVSRRLGFIPAPRVAPAGGGGQMARGAPQRPLHSWDFKSTQRSADFLRHTRAERSDPDRNCMQLPENVIQQTLSSDFGLSVRFRRWCSIGIL